jgi:hypothetical protein
MAQKLFNTQLYRPKDFKGLIADNHFYELYQQKPQLLEKAIQQIYQTNLQGSMVNFVNRFPTMEVELENGFYQWMLKGQEDKNVPLVEIQDGAGAAITSGAHGSGRQRVRLVFDEPMFERTNVIKGETDDYHFLVKEVHETDGRYAYEVELLNDDLDVSFVIGTDLSTGDRFSKFYDLVPGTLSYEGAEPWFTSPFKMQNRLSMCRMQYKVPGSSIEKGQNEPLEFPFMYRGQTESVWINYIDLVVMYQAEELMARASLYGKKNWTVDSGYLNFDDVTGFEIGAGSGFFEQIAPANRHMFNTFDLDYLMEVSLDMSIGKIGRGDRHLHVITGERGAIEIHKQIQAKAGADTIYNSVTDGGGAYRGASAGNTGAINPMGFGYQFVEYSYYNGIKLTVEIADFMDDDVYFPKRHPEGAGIAESHRMIVMGYGESAEVHRVRPKGRDDMYAYIAGLRDPFTAGGKGKTSPKMISTPIDGYEVHSAKFGGLVMKDPTKVLDFQLNVNQ